MEVDLATLAERQSREYGPILFHISGNRRDQLRDINSALRAVSAAWCSDKIPLGFRELGQVDLSLSGMQCGVLLTRGAVDTP
jgi:hypothetical protein